MYSRPDPRHRPALLPVHRRQGRALRREGAASGFRRAGGSRHIPGSTSTASRTSLPRGRAGRRRPLAARVRNARDRALRLRGRVRLREPASSSIRRCRYAASTVCSWPARSTAPRATKRRPRRGCWPASTPLQQDSRRRAGHPPPRPGLRRGDDRRPRHARHRGALPDVHLPRGAPPAPRLRLRLRAAVAGRRATGYPR